MFYGQCWKCGERWSLGTASTCTCEPEQPQRTWVGLTSEERWEVYSNWRWSKSISHFDLCELTEAKLRSKNT